MKKLSFLSLSGVLLATASAYALDCATPPSCSDLGYTKTAADCEGLDTLKCPFDTTAVFCKDAEEVVDNTTTCAAGVNYNPTTKTCYNDGTVGTYIYLDSSYYLDTSLTSSSGATYSIAATTMPTCSSGSVLTYSDINTLKTFLNKNYAPTCIFASGTGQIYHIAEDNVLTKIASQTNYEYTNANGGCVELFLVTNNNYVLPTVTSTNYTPYAFAAIDTIVSKLECVCKTENALGECTSCPTNCSLSDGRCYGDNSGSSGVSPIIKELVGTVYTYCKRAI